MEREFCGHDHRISLSASLTNTLRLPLTLPLILTHHHQASGKVSPEDAKAAVQAGAEAVQASQLVTKQRLSFGHATQAVKT